VQEFCDRLKIMCPDWRTLITKWLCQREKTHANKT
jgi:hypothetical protein